MSSWIVSGAGTTTANGTYDQAGTYNGQPYYQLDSGHCLYFVNGGWTLGPALGNVLEAFYGDGTTLPGGGWLLGPAGASPAPVVAPGENPIPSPYAHTWALTIESPASGATVGGTLDAQWLLSTDDSVGGPYDIWLDGYVEDTRGRYAAIPLTKFIYNGGASGLLSVDMSALANGPGALGLVAYPSPGTPRLAGAEEPIIIGTVAPTGSPPTCSILHPSNGATVSGPLSVSVQANSAAGLASVSLFQDYGLSGQAPLGTQALEGTASGATFVWHTNSVANGVHTLTAIATDINTLTSTPHTISVAVNNVTGGDTTPPSITITAPPNGATVAGVVPLVATITDEQSGVDHAILYADGAPQGTLGPSATGSTYTWPWDSRQFLNGPCTLGIEAWDNAGNHATASISVTAVNALADQTRVLYTLDPSTVAGSDWTTAHKALCIEVPDVHAADLPSDPAAQYNVTLYRECPIALSPPDYAKMQRLTAFRSGSPAGTGSVVRWAMVAVPRQAWAYWTTGSTAVLRIGVLDNGNLVILTTGPAALYQFVGTGLMELADLSGLSPVPTDMAVVPGKVIVTTGTSLHVYDQVTGHLDFTVTPGQGITAINQLVAHDTDLYLVCAMATGGALFNFTYPDFSAIATWTSALERVLVNTANGNEVLAGDSAGKIVALSSGRLSVAYDTGQSGGVTAFGLNGATLYAGTGTSGLVFKRVGGAWAQAADLDWASVAAIVPFRGWTYLAGPSAQLWRESADLSWNLSVAVPGSTAVNAMLATSKPPALWLATSNASNARLVRLEFGAAGDLVCGAQPPNLQFKALRDE